MYNVPSQQNVAKIVVDESVIQGESEPLLVYENTETARAAAED
jgi:ATP-dependent Clp protease ATP-binding subunit ClpX